MKADTMLVSAMQLLYGILETCYPFKRNSPLHVPNKNRIRSVVI